MATKKYNLIDQNGEIVGFVVVKQPAQFEQTAPMPAAISGGPAADAVLFATVLGGFTGAAWLLPGPGWIAPTVGITITAALAGIKAWRSGSPASEPTPAASPDAVTIKLETWSEDKGRVLLDEIKDQTITLEEWRKVAAAITEGVNFSRPALTAYVSQNTWHKIKGELVRLNMAHKQGNGYTLSPRGLKLFKKIGTLPR